MLWLPWVMTTVTGGAGDIDWSCLSCRPNERDSWVWRNCPNVAGRLRILVRLTVTEEVVVSVECSNWEDCLKLLEDSNAILRNWLMDNSNGGSLLELLLTDTDEAVAVNSCT